MWSYWSPLSGWLLFVVFICQFVADVGCLSIRCLCAAVVHDKIPLESVMKWCSMQVIIFSFPSVVDCCLFYFFVCCCMLLHIVVYCCMLLFVAAWLMRCSKWILIIRWCKHVVMMDVGCWNSGWCMLMMHVNDDDAMWNTLYFDANCVNYHG